MKATVAHKPQSKFDALAENFVKEAGVERGKFFGFHSMTAGGKTFAVSFHEDMVFKLDDKARNEALALAGAALWNPYGRRKKQWVQIPAAHAQQWKAFAATACEYVSGLVR